ncbi:MAG: hypothetical protein V4607_02005 [Pseudomonadota bacterium]
MKAQRKESGEKVVIKRQFLQQLLLSVSANPAALADLSPDQVQLLKQAVLRARRGLKESLELSAVPQLALELPPQKKWKNQSRSTRRSCKYPYKMIEDARKMRGNGYFYKEIAAALEKEYGIKVPWITVRDWVNYYYRVMG